MKALRDKFRNSAHPVLYPLAGVAGFFGMIMLLIMVYFNSTLPSVGRLEDPDYALPTLIYDRHNTKIAEIFIKRRKLVKYEQFPQNLINGLIAKEDSRFFDHHGIDPLRILKAAWVNLMAWRTVQGASTLTQQTARQFFLTLDKTFSRKIREALLALKIESEFTKEEILTLYLNKVNFGDAWGVAAAAEVYYNKKVEDLSLSESATLVGLLPAPNAYKPTRSPRKARQQRNIVLSRMATEGFITRTEQMAAASEPIVLVEGSDPTKEASAYYVELVRRQLHEKFGTKGLYEGGLHVFTAMDLEAQIAAHKALNEGVRRVDRRRGYRGVQEKIELDEFGQVKEEDLVDLNPANVRVGFPAKGIVTEVSDDRVRVALGPLAEGTIFWDFFKEQWAGRVDPEKQDVVLAVSKFQEVVAPGDLIEVMPSWREPSSGEYRLDLYQSPLANGALYASNPQTGEVIAMVGGTKFGKGVGASEFIRATQAERQPGSSFKPIIYAAAIDEGYTPATVLDDSPRVFTLPTGKKHIPKNYDHRYLGNISLRHSLVRSRNVPTVQLVEEIGARKVIEYAQRFGFTTAIPEEAIIALGTHSVKLNEMTHAFGVFAAGGNLAKPLYILKITNQRGEVLLENTPENTPVISPATAYMVADILQDVVRSPIGTAHRVMKDLGRPAGGKTGTTQNYSDAWFLGFIPQLVAGVYVGFDDPSRSLGPAESGGKAAAPIWKEFIMAIQHAMPIEAFQQPPTVVAHRVGKTGQLLSPCDVTEGSRLELFKATSIPKRLLTSAGCGGPSRRNIKSSEDSEGENVDL